jgi:hypothetical protein
MLSDAFVAVLKSDRQGCNARFEHARREYPTLDGADFSAFLEQTADPVVHAVAQADARAAADIGRAVYDLGLALVGQRLAGPRARFDWIDQAWRRVLCANAALVAGDPLGLAGAVSNAVHHLATTPGARPGKWIDAMEKLGAHAGPAAAFLQLGQVLAWRCGLAQFRAGALDVACALPEALALVAVGAPRDAKWADVHARLRADPWHVPGRDATSAGVVARVGGFRGFGGLFAEPPRVAAADGQLFVHSGTDCWLLAADAFGATFHRASSPEAEGARPVLTNLPRQTQLPPEAGEPTSIAATPTTLAVTTTLTHRVLLYARSGG